jgi:hypothetical protein
VATPASRIRTTHATNSARITAAVEHPVELPVEVVSTENRHAKGTITQRRSATMLNVADIKTVDAAAALAIKRATAAVESTPAVEMFRMFAKYTLISYQI